MGQTIELTDAEPTWQADGHITFLWAQITGAGASSEN